MAQRNEAATAGTAVATTTEQPKSGVAKRVDERVAELRAQNQLVAAIRGTQWGMTASPELARTVAHYCNENGIDAVRHVEVLGGRIYLTGTFYDERGAHLIRDGVILVAEPDLISADPRLDELAAAGDEWATAERTRRVRERIRHGVPEKALAACVQKFTVAASGAVIYGVNWCGGTGRRDPVGDAEPTKTAITRARRRAWIQIADVLPSYAADVRRIEEATKRVSASIPPVAVVEPDRGPKALVAGGYDEPSDAPVSGPAAVRVALGIDAPAAPTTAAARGSWRDTLPTPPAQHSDDPALSADDLEFDDEQGLIL